MGAVSSGAPECKIINGKCQQESGWTVVHLVASHVRDVDNDIGGMRGKSSLVVPRLNFCLRLQCLRSFPVFVLLTHGRG